MEIYLIQNVKNNTAFLESTKKGINLSTLNRVYNLKTYYICGLIKMELV